jgi:hypothetical protein
MNQDKDDYRKSLLCSMNITNLGRANPLTPESEQVRLHPSDKI